MPGTPLPALLLVPLCLPVPAEARDIFLDGVTIAESGTDPDLFVTDESLLKGDVCIGVNCLSSVDNPTGVPLIVDDSDHWIDFEDNAGGSKPTRDWRLRVNDRAVSGLTRFSIQDLTAATIPFTVEGNAPDNALRVDNTGRIGLGTTLPQQDIHLLGGGEAGLRLEDSTGTPCHRDLRGNDFGVYVFDVEHSNIPFEVQAGAPNRTLYLADDGNVGLGTEFPTAPLEVWRQATFSFFRLTADDAPTNTSADVVFTQGPLGTGELRYNIVDGDGPEMRLDAEGNAILTGRLTTAGPTCAGGCDAVFDADFPRPSIAAHAAEMWRLGHLPAVGPTVPGAPIDVSGRMGTMLNALEHAHISIDQLHRRLEAQEAAQAALRARLTAQDERHAALLARLEALETGGN